MRKVQGSEYSNHFYKVPLTETLQTREKNPTEGNITVRGQIRIGARGKTSDLESRKLGQAHFVYSLAV